MRVTGNRSNPGLFDYLRAFRKRGVAHSLTYFFEAHLFDLRNGTDTNIWLWRGQFSPPPENIEHGTCYMASWTSEIRRSFKAISSLLDNLSAFAFVDIGCGKGKALLVWQQLLNGIDADQRVYGVDYYQPLIDVARQNHSTVFGGPGNFICADATALDYGGFGPRLILYLYNPFDEVILDRVLRKITNEEVYIIYTNPVHAHVLDAFGYEQIYERSGSFPILHTKIYKNRPARRRPS